MAEFMVGGQRFILEPLSVKEALKGLPILTESILPTLAGGIVGLSDPGLVRTIVHGLSRLDELVDLFVARCKVERDLGNGNTTIVPLGPMIEATFKGKTAALLVWLIECVSSQYADFLPGSGPNLLEARAKQFASLLGLTGGSGESSATAESQTV